MNYGFLLLFFARSAEAPSKLEELEENLVYLAQVFP